MKRKNLLAVIPLLFLILLDKAPQKLPIESKPFSMKAEIKGEVIEPGVYEIKEDETLQDLIEKAKGLTKQADLRSLSLKKPILSDDLIVIPRMSEVKKISLNTATLEELMNLKGIGESKAQKIIEYRKQHLFTHIEQLMEVKGIGEKIFENNKDQLAL